MESAEMQHLRYLARKYGLRCRRFKGGYRFYHADNGSLVASVNNLTCNRTMTRNEVKGFLADLETAKRKNNVIVGTPFKD